jgi:NAD(P)H-flavin reductase
MNIKPHSFEAKLVSKQQLTDKFFLFQFKTCEKFVFNAGQYVSIKVTEDGVRRPYSVASKPSDETIELLIDITPGGPGTKFLMGLNEGDSVEMMGPVGRFILDDDLNDESKLFFVGTGSGIAPLKSMILDLLEDRRIKNKIKLVWGLRYEKDAFWRKEFDKLKKEFDNFDYEITLSADNKNWKGKTGRVTSWTAENSYSANDKFYLCGNGQMVIDVDKILLDKGIPRENIYFEKFN